MAAAATALPCVEAAAEAAEAVEAVAVVVDAEEPQPWAQTTAAVEDRRCGARACRKASGRVNQNLAN